MLEITFEHKDIFELFKENNHVYKDGVYDFTFEGRFAVYHCHYKNELVYISLDMETGYNSQILVKPDGVLYTEKEYNSIVPAVLNSIKYTGDRRSAALTNADPMDVIELIFKTIMPRYGYKLRYEQMNLAKAMYRSITQKTVGICEAEVGTGKTLAYLVAAVVARTRMPSYVTSNPITVVTSSIELQTSIVEKDLPRLSEMLCEYGVIHKPLKVVLRKGKEHYMCYSRYQTFMKSLERRPRKNKKLIEYLKEHDYEKNGFDLDKTKLPPNVKDKICVKGLCAKCQYRDKCRYGKFRYFCQFDEDIDVQVTNHNLYLVTKKIKTDILQNSFLVIVDEAHKFKDTALDVFGVRINEKEVSLFIDAMRDVAVNKGIEDKYKKTLKSLKFNTKALFKSMARHVREEEDGNINDNITLTVKERERVEEIVYSIRRINKSTKIATAEYKNWCQNLLEGFEAFIRPHDITVWVEKDDSENIVICATYKDIGRILYNNVWNKATCHILTSGTMSDGTSFDYFREQNGISIFPRRCTYEKSVPSPFDYQSHTRLYIPTDMPTPDNSEKYFKVIADRVVDLVNATNGHTAILFTSYKALSEIYLLTKDKLKKYELFVMTRGDKNVIKNFKNSKNGVIFASGSIWEGVDCPGDCLSSVIIVRLPFPLRTAILQEKKKKCKNFTEFSNKYTTPEMIIKLRQGVGRLIRTETDTGVISILDSRSYNMAYSKAIEEVLKKYPRVSSVEEVSRFIKGIKPKEYFDN